MDPDPYSTPESKITATAAVEGPQRPVRGIVLALQFDFGGTTIAAAILTVLGSVFFASMGYSAEDVTSIV